MTVFPNKPFLTKNFSKIGGGVDFLGLQQVNLAMVNDRLLGGINNATRDLGTYCLAAWIPWKFRERAKGKREFVKKKYITLET